MQSEMQQKMATLREQITQGLAAFLPDREPLTLYEPMRYAMAGGGKMLRPMLLLMSCEAVGGKTKAALPAAVALELVHNFTLVHDDIMDHDELRRGRETVYKKWDENIAILAGDGLLVQAFNALCGCESVLLPKVLSSFTTGILEVCEGQAMDKEFELKDFVSLEQYYVMIAKKTGRLFSLACEIGGLLGHGQAEQVQGLAQFGALLGRAFQIQDDVLDIAAEEGVLGKDIGSDLRENKKSFLLAHLYQFGAAAQQAEIRRLSQKTELTETDIVYATTLFREAGTLQAAEMEIDQCIEKAEAALALLPNKAGDGLSQLLKSLARRKF